MPWQRQVWDTALELDADGSWAYRLVVVTVPRQAGKTTAVGPVALHRCLTTPDARCWLTAQRRQDARDTWRDVATRVERSPLAPLVDRRLSNGSESLHVTPTGGTFRVFAPVEDALHGKANHLVIVDEAWAFDAAQGVALEAAIVPTFTTTGGQLWVVSTAGTGASTWLRRFVDRARADALADRAGPVALFDWSLDPALVPLVSAGIGPDATPADRAAALDAVAGVHPGAGHTLRRDALDQAAATMTASEFLRAYGNVWTASADRIVPAHEWDACAVADWPPPEPGAVALGFDVAVDRRDAAVCAAWRDPAGRLRVDVIDAHPGTSWVVPRVRELAARWRVAEVGHDAAGPALDLADELARSGTPVSSTTTRQYAAACASFLAAVADRRLAHRGVPALDDAVDAAATRPLGDAWAWSRRTSAGTIAPLVAATVAAWGLDHRPAPPARPVVVSSRRRVLG